METHHSARKTSGGYQKLRRNAAGTGVTNASYNPRSQWQISSAPAALRDDSRMVFPATASQ